MRAALSFLALASLLPSSGVLGAPPNLTGTRVELRPATPLAEAVRAERRVAWLAFELPLVPGDHDMCCWTGPFGTSRGQKDRPKRGGCRLDGDSYFTGTDTSERRPAGRRLQAFVLVKEGRVAGLRAMASDCPVDAGEQAVVWLTSVEPAAAAVFLEEIAASSRDDERVDGAVSLLGLMAGEESRASLERLLLPARGLKVRESAAFWLCQTRGAEGLATPLRLLESDPDSELRKRLTFAVSQSPEAKAVPALLHAAREDPDAEVRAQALFWLAQRAADTAVGAIEEALERDPDTGLKEQAVFALTQLPKDESVTQLLRLARTHRNAAVRKQALFWLGQSRDPRAVGYMEEVLLR